MVHARIAANVVMCVTALRVREVRQHHGAGTSLLGQHSSCSIASPFTTRTNKQENRPWRRRVLSLPHPGSSQPCVYALVLTLCCSLVPVRCLCCYVHVSTPFLHATIIPSRKDPLSSEL